MWYIRFQRAHFGLGLTSRLESANVTLNVFVFDLVMSSDIWLQYTFYHLFSHVKS
jgi:hypothetical protein